MRNLNLLFNKTYYDCLGQSDENAHFDKVNKALFSTAFEEGDYRESELKGQDGFCSFCMKTSYPGMLIGVGYAHGAGIDGADDDINLGFSFDYTSGQPYIPGSTVKGVLRHTAKLFAENSKDVIDAIFESGNDIFLDAVIIRPDTGGHILGEDYITPHKDAIKNPVPIKMMKILPDVIFEFRFILRDDEAGTADEKRKFFIKLLTLSGVGAKTHTGYGALEHIEYSDVEKRPFGKAGNESEAKTARSASSDKAHKSVPAAEETISAVNGTPEVGKVYTGTVRNITNFGAFVRIDGTKKEGLVHISQIADTRVENVNDFLSIGEKVKIKVLEIKADGKISLSIKQAGK